MCLPQCASLPLLSSSGGVGRASAVGGVAVDPQEATRISKLKSDSLKVFSQIMPVKLSFKAILDRKNFNKLPKPLLKRFQEIGGPLRTMSDAADSRASGTSTTPLPFSIEDVKEAVKDGTP